MAHAARQDGADDELPAESQHLPAEALPDKSEWLRFNVGGARLETTRGSLEKLGSSFFALLLDGDDGGGGGEDQRAAAVDRDGAYRLDRDPDALRVLLNYGRYGRLVAVPDHLTEPYLLAEVRSYGMEADVARAVRAFYEGRQGGPGAVRLESVTLSEMAVDRGRLHHNVYHVMGGAGQICCYTKLPGSGTCYRQVSNLFAHEKPHSKFPALFRATCLQCRRKVCLADDPIIGLEGWCHRCRLCLRCQDLLCDPVAASDETAERARHQGDEAAAATGPPGAGPEDQEPAGSMQVRKTASVVFVCDARPPPPKSPPPARTAVDDLGRYFEADVDEGTGAAIARAAGLATLRRPAKLPPVVVTKAQGAPTVRRKSTTDLGTPGLTESAKGYKNFKEFLLGEKWSL